MRLHSMQYAARVALKISHAVSPRCMQPRAMGPAEIKATKEAIRTAFESQWRTFGIADNRFTRDDIRWQWWNELAEAKLREEAAKQPKGELAHA